MAILQRKILFGGIAVLIVLAILSVVFLYQPKIQARGKIQAEVNDLKKQIADLKEQVKGIGAVRRQIEQLESQNSELMSHVAPRDQLLTILRELAKIGERYNITFLEITPPGLDTMLQIETQDKPIRPVPFQIVLQGRYIDIGNYVENLVQFPYFVKIPEFEITGKEEIRPAVEARLLVNLYTSSLPFAQQPEVVPSSGASTSGTTGEKL
jgi:Tfp pilus assembly protein PilO